MNGTMVSDSGPGGTAPSPDGCCCRESEPRPCRVEVELSSSSVDFGKTAGRASTVLHGGPDDLVGDSVEGWTSESPFVHLAGGPVGTSASGSCPLAHLTSAHLTSSKTAGAAGRGAIALFRILGKLTRGAVEKRRWPGRRLPFAVCACCVKSARVRLFASEGVGWWEGNIILCLPAQMFRGFAASRYDVLATGNSWCRSSWRTSGSA